MGPAEHFASNQSVSGLFFSPPGDKAMCGVGESHARFLLLKNNVSIASRDFIEYLRRENKEIYLISGGFHCLIDPVAEELSIPMNHLFANKLHFDFNGNYAGFDTNQPTSRSGGKGEAITQIRMFNSSQLQTRSNLNIVMIGGKASTNYDARVLSETNIFVIEKCFSSEDGATDLETVPPADHFIGS